MVLCSEIHFAAKERKERKGRELCNWVPFNRSFAPEDLKLPFPCGKRTGDADLTRLQGRHAHGVRLPHGNRTAPLPSSEGVSTGVPSAREIS